MMALSRIIIEPSFQGGYATSMEEALFPVLWKELSVAFYPSMGRQPRKFKDFANKRGVKAPLNYAEARAVWLDGSWRYEYTATSQELIFGSIDEYLALNNVTILIGYMRSDSTNRNSGVFGDSSGVTAQKAQILLPWSDGEAYFAFGGATAGVSRVDTINHLTGSAITYGDDDWAFTTGTRGMEMWQNGQRVAHAPSANPTRTANSLSNLRWAGSSARTNDLASYKYVVIYNRQLSPEEIDLFRRYPKAPLMMRNRISLNTGPTILTESVAQTLGVSDTNAVQGIFSRSLTDGSIVSQSMVGNSIRNISILDTISFTDTSSAIEEASSTLTFIDGMIYLLAVADRQVPESVLAFTQTVTNTGNVQVISHDLGLTDSLTVVGPVPVSEDSILGLTDGVSYCFGAPWATIDVSHNLNLSDVLGTAFPVAVTSTITFVDGVFQNHSQVQELNFQQIVTVGKASGIIDTLQLVQAVASNSLLNRGIVHADFISQAFTYYIDNGCNRKSYNRFEGGSSSIPEKHLTFDADFVLETLTGSKQKLILRTPENDDRQRIGFQRVNRETRGGELNVFEDSIWPKVTTLLFTIVAIRGGLKGCPDAITSLMDFMQNNLGKEILIHDWEGISWRGVIITPNEVATEDKNNYWTLAFEFEGIALDGSQGDQRLAISDAVAMNADWNRDFSSTLALSHSVGVAGVLGEALTETLTLNQSVTGTLETISLSDNFSGSALAVLNALSPDIGGSVWFAHSNYKADGSQTAINGGAYYPFAPVSGNIYHIEWKPRLLAESANLETSFFLGEGLPASADATGIGAYGKTNPTTLKAGFVLRLVAANQLNACRLGDTIDGEADTVDFSDATLKAEADNIDLRLVLDTTGGASTWTVTWYAKATASSIWTKVRSENKLLSEDITIVGWANNNTTTTVDMSDISITKKLVV